MCGGTPRSGSGTPTPLYGIRARCGGTPRGGSGHVVFMAPPLCGNRARCGGTPRGGSGRASRLRPLPSPVFLTLS
ncbi:unnamed protein product [Schistocephalus solidus]|uniref:Uncharacterized protein n=1 Tax=Schistocephalus solidus TaxID=70667 RepID=A0A183T7G1_SCHSO|nr:unnamed protein product [Schistocephalus solidus]